MKSLLAVFVALALLVPSALAQESGAEDGCPVGELEMASADDASADDASARDGASGRQATSSAYGAAAVTSPTPAVDVEARTDAEATVQDVIARDGVHVVHFWAPWCSNATNELDSGWADLVDANPEVTFTFVSIWNDGAEGHDVLQSYGVDPSGRVTTLQQPDLGPSDDASQRRRQFLGLPVTWSPSTWIFHEKGELAFALNYGEMEMNTIQSLLDATRADW